MKQDHSDFGLLLQTGERHGCLPTTQQLAVSLSFCHRSSCVPHTVIFPLHSSSGLVSVILRSVEVYDFCSITALESVGLADCSKLGEIFI